MEHNTTELISAAYTVYTLINPSNQIIVSIDSFAEAFKNNVTALENTMGLHHSDMSREPFSEQKAEDTLKNGFQEAEKTLDDKEKLSSLLSKVKEKMKTLPMVGSVLANVPTMFKLLNSYLKGDYTSIPKKQLIIIVSALSYLIAPIDLIPDFIPVIGLLDDMAIVSVCIKATKDELNEYLVWREINKADSLPDDE